MQLFADVHECRPAMRIDASHASITDGGEQHRNHRAQNRRDNVASRFLVNHTEARHRSCRLNQNDAIEHQVPEAQTAPECYLPFTHG